MSARQATCPVCNSTEECEPTCVIGTQLNDWRNRTIRVYVDENGDEFLNANDIDKVVRSHIAVTQVTNGPMNPMTDLICHSLGGLASVIMGVTDPESPARVLVSDIDTSVPDTVPSDWLNDAPGGQS